MGFLKQIPYESLDDKIHNGSWEEWKKIHQSGDGFFLRFIYSCGWTHEEYKNEGGMKTPRSMHVGRYRRLFRR